jgi:hypothetical protein
MPTSAEHRSLELAWLDPAHPASPQDALVRIQGICAMYPALDAAVLLIAATHQAVPRDVLAAAIKRYRADTEPLSQKDVVNLLVAVVNGGKQGFDAVLRTRKSSGARPPSAMSWVKE